MATHILHNNKQALYFVTFTCYKWLPLIAKTNLYDFIKPWSEELAKKGIKICGYVIMPNHIHILVYVTQDCQGLNLVMGEAKRFMADEIVKRLTKLGYTGLLKTLRSGVQKQKRVKGKKHQVFRLSFDAKEVIEDDDINGVLNYIYHNPVSGKWELVEDYIDYPYSSAGFYEEGSSGLIKVTDYREFVKA